MARRFFKKARRIGSRFARRAYRAASKTSVSPTTAALYGLGYGAARPLVTGLVRPVSNYLPLGSFNDEVAMSLLGFAAAKWGSGMVKNIGRTALTVEAASIGAQLVSGVGTVTASQGMPIN